MSTKLPALGMSPPLPDDLPCSCLNIVSWQGASVTGFPMYSEQGRQIARLPPSNRVAHGNALPSALRHFKPCKQRRIPIHYCRSFHAGPAELDKCETLGTFLAFCRAGGGTSGPGSLDALRFFWPAGARLAGRPFFFA